MPNQFDICAQTDLALTSVPGIKSSGFYFVAAHTLQGTRFYSESIATLQQGEYIFNQYIDVIDYFGGGSVELYKIDIDDYEIIAYRMV